MGNTNKKSGSSLSDVLLEKEKLYLEEDISPEVKSILDDVFAEMVSDDTNTANSDTTPIKAPVEIPKDEKISSASLELLSEKEKFYAEEEISPEVKAVLDDVFAEMVSDEESEVPVEDISEYNIEEANKESPIGVDNEKEKIIEDLSSTVNDSSAKIKELEEKIEFYQDLVKDFEGKSNMMEISKNQFEERLKELDESRSEFEERGKKLEHARESFKKLSKNLEEKRIELDQREKNLNQLKRELDSIKQRTEEENSIIPYKKQKVRDSVDPKTTTHNSDLVQVSEEDLSGSELMQMERGKIDILQDILQELLYQGDFQSCFLIDGQGMIISEYSKTELDALAIGAMFSLVCTTVLRTVRSLSLSELEYFKLSSINGEFILRNIDINNYERNFILLAYYNESNSNIPMKKRQLSRKTIRKIMKSVKKDFNESRKDSRISWIFDNLSDKIDFLKQRYNQFEGDINLIRLNLMNKASLKLRELFEM